MRVEAAAHGAVTPAKLQVEDLVEREPDRVASQVREWMAEE